MFIDLRERKGDGWRVRGRGREGEREKNIDQLPTVCTPTGTY